SAMASRHSAWSGSSAWSSRPTSARSAYWRSSGWPSRAWCNTAARRSRGTASPARSFVSAATDESALRTRKILGQRVSELDSPRAAPFHHGPAAIAEHKHETRRAQQGGGDRRDQQERSAQTLVGSRDILVQRPHDLQHAAHVADLPFRLVLVAIGM